MQKIIKWIADMIFKQITDLGGFIFYGFLLLTTLTFQEFMLFWKLSFGFVLTASVVVLIRTFYFRDRPKKQQFHNYIEKIDASSFPSLHAARTIFLYLTLINLFNNNYFTPLLTFIALAVIYSRYYLKKHDFYDLLGGIILGVITYGISWLF